MSTALELLLLRHGEAAEGIADPPLSARGRQVVQATAGHPALADWREIDLLVHSPLRRAIETAGLLAGQLSPAESHFLPELEPRTSGEVAGRALVEIVAALPRTDAAVRRVAVVAHLPVLPDLAAWLCDAALPFAPGHGWLLAAEDEALAWQGIFTIRAPVDDGDTH